MRSVVAGRVTPGGCRVSTLGRGGPRFGPRRQRGQVCRDVTLLGVAIGRRSDDAQSAVAPPSRGGSSLHRRVEW